MNLHLRKMLTGQIEQSKLPGRHAQQDTLTLDYYEDEIVEAFSEDSGDVALGKLTVLIADVLEIARRADPAYGLKSIGAGVLEGRIGDLPQRMAEADSDE